MHGRLLALVALFIVASSGCDPVKAVTDAAPPGVDAAIDGGGTATAELTVVLGGTATGTVTSMPAGITCGASCTGSFPVGTLVTLTAAPAAGASFTGWGGGCSGALPTCSLVVNAASAVNAGFDIQRHTVTVMPAGNGTGRVTSPAGGIDCPGTCTITVDHGTSLVLAATASPGSTFLGWSGACTGGGTCAITVNDDVQVSAAFGQSQSLVVTRSGAGGGTVTSAPAGITCGTDCAEVYAPGTMVTLTATPAADSTFVGWSGACSGAATTCVVTIDAATAVDARFDLRQFTLTVTRAGTGTGTVNNLSGSTGINCGADCTENYNAGMMVGLLATPAADNVFSGWSGDCTGAFGPCQLTMSQARSARATFDLAPTVTLTLSVYGSGTLRSSPSPVMGPSVCTSTDPNTTLCTLTFNRGAAVSLTPAPAGGYALIDISGCTLAGGTCTLTMNASTTVSAYFCGTGPCPI
ncbi:MAG: hypothetical protein IPL61_08945 [Myxococcales bacterium]|nr:hypothetical protein [Myxococcales bacterium]